MRKVMVKMGSVGLGAVLAISALAMAAPANAVAFGMCDPDGDNLVTQADLLIIRNANGQAATGLTDPRDGNSDGGINIADARYCQLRLGTIPN